MGDWIIGAFINLIGSIAINFGTNLLKLGHNERNSLQDIDGTSGKLPLKPIIHFQTWRIGILIFMLGNCLNFISFGYAAQSLLAALGSVQFVSNIAFAYFVLHKMVSVKVLVATAFIVLGNVFLVAFGNHQSPVYTPEQLSEKYSNITFLMYCFILALVVIFHHFVYRRGELLFSFAGHELRPYWRMLLPFSYAVVSGAVGSCSVLFAKSLSNLLRLSLSSNYQLHSWFTYSMLLLFLSTAGFWMARLNEGLSLFDAILIVPMFQIAWTFFSICTGFVYFQEYQVFNTLRTTMFILGMSFVFTGISLLAPDESRGIEGKDGSSVSSLTSSVSSEVDRLIQSHGDTQSKEPRSFLHETVAKIMDALVKAKNACSGTLGLADDPINASVILVMPMVSSKMGFRGNALDRSKLLSMKSFAWGRISLDDEDAKMLDRTPKLSVYASLSLSSDDPSLEIHDHNHDLRRTPTDREGDGNPEWNHTLSLDLNDILSSLPHDAYDRVFVRFDLFHEGGMFGDKRISEVHVALSEVIEPEGRGSVRFVSYQVKNPEAKPNGVLTFSYKFEGELDCELIGNGFAAIAGFPIVHPVDETSGSSGSASSSGIHYPKVDLEEHVVQEMSYYPPPGTRCHAPQAPPLLGYPMPPPMQTAAGGGCYYPAAQPMPAFEPWGHGHHHGYRHHCSTRGGGGW